MHGSNGINNDDDDDNGDDEDDDLFVNPNHQKTTCYVDSDSSEESEDNEQWHPIFNCLLKSEYIPDWRDMSVMEIGVLW